MKATASFAVLEVYLALNIGPASAYTALFAFGDSLSDVRNLFDLEGIPGPPYVGGHFSNGPTWVEDLSTDLGLAALKPGLSGGTDFAFGDAATGCARSIDLNNQVAAFEAYAALYSPSAVLNGALFTLDIGANDIIDALSDPSTAATVVTAAAKSAADEVKELHADGASSFLFYDAPQLGVTPEIKALGSAAQTLAECWPCPIQRDPAVGSRAAGDWRRPAEGLQFGHL